MELEFGAKAVREVEFRERIRGYHQDDVDEFLEKVAAGIEILERRLRDAEQKAQSSSTAQSSQLPMSMGGDTIQRTLLLAQHTADQVVRDAHVEAEQIRQDATARAAKMIEDANYKVTVELETKVNALNSELVELASRKTAVLDEIQEINTKVDEARLDAATLLREFADQLSHSIPARAAVDLPTIDSAVNQSVEDAEFEVDEVNEFPVADGETEVLFVQSNPFFADDSAETADDDEGDSDVMSLDFGRSQFRLIEDESEYSNPVLFDDEDHRI